MTEISDEESRKILDEYLAEWYEKEKEEDIVSFLEAIKIYIEKENKYEKKIFVK